LEKCGTLGERCQTKKKRHTWKNSSNVKCGKLGKMRLIWKKAAHLEKWATLGNIRQTRKDGPH